MTLPTLPYATIPASDISPKGYDVLTAKGKLEAHFDTREQAELYLANKRGKVLRYYRKKED